MALSEWLHRISQHFIDAAYQKDLNKLITILREAYLDEVKDLTLFTQHAERIYYPHLRERFQRVVAKEQTHIQWLQEKILALGGDLPTPSEPAKLGNNSWENLRMDLEKEKKDYAELLEGLKTAERFDPAIAEELRRIRYEERKLREELLDLFLKTEPIALPHLITGGPDVEKQKQTWLEQQKIEWLDKKRAMWEADGKPTPWIEWVTQRESEWKANELPNRELVWILRLAEAERLSLVLPDAMERTYGR